MNALTIDAGKCTACRVCELACSFVKAETFSPALSRIRVVRFEEEGLNMPMSCQQCEDAPCVAGCPSGAMHRDPDLDIVGWDADKCIFCRMCTMACPFGAVIYHSPRSIIKCDLCGGEPACVDQCMYGALTFKPLSTLTQRKRWASAESLLAEQK